MNVGVMRGAVKIYAQICLLFCIFLFAQLIVPYPNGSLTSNFYRLK